MREYVVVLRYRVIIIVLRWIDTPCAHLCHMLRHLPATYLAGEEAENIRRRSDAPNTMRSD